MKVEHGFKIAVIKSSMHVANLTLNSHNNSSESETESCLKGQSATVAGIVVTVYFFVSVRITHTFCRRKLETLTSFTNIKKLLC